MGSIPKALMDNLSSKVVYHAHDTWVKKALLTCRVRLILLDEIDIDVVKVVFPSCFDGISVALGVAEVAR